MNKLVFPFLLVLLFSCSQKIGSQKLVNREEVIFNRIEYLYSLKTLIDENIWNDFSDEKFDLPLIYYTDSACYIANPTEKIIDEFQPELLYKSDLVKIYKSYLIDSLPFHMEASIIFGNDTTFYNYQSPVINSSSVEITEQTIPDVNSTELWATMLLHEYFHGFQFKHKQYQRYLRDHPSSFSQDSLKSIYQNNIWFKKSVNKENQLLIDAISSNDSVLTIQLIDSVLIVRGDRREMAIQKLGIDIAVIEARNETLEGSARYVEYRLYDWFSTKSMSHPSLETDSSFHQYDYFQNFTIENEKWLYMTEKTAYFYATGFNIIRLMDKLNIEYKTKLFQEEGLTLEDILKEFKDKH